MPKDHPLARDENVTVEELAHEPLILPKTGHTRVVIDRFCPGPSQRILQISMELASVETIEEICGRRIRVSP